MNTLVLKTNRELVNEPVLVHIMQYNDDIKKLINVGGYEFPQVSSTDGIIKLNIGDNIKHKTGEDYTLNIPYGSILRVECPKGSNPIFIEDMLHLNPNRSAELYAEMWPNESSNVAKVIIDEDGFKVTLNDARVGVLELYEISSKENPSSVVQRLTMSTNTSSNIYVFTPTIPVNVASNYVVVRWSIADNSKPAGVGITAIDLTTAPRVEVGNIVVSNGKVNVSIRNLDTTSAFVAKEADVYFKYGEDVIVVRGKVENDTVSGTGKVILPGFDNETLNKMNGNGIATVVLIGENNNTVDHTINIDHLKTDPDGISINTGDITFNDAGNRVTFLVKNEKDIPGSSITLNELSNEYVAGKIIYDEPVIREIEKEGKKYWEVTIDNINSIPNNRLYDTHVKVNYIEPNKIPVIVADAKPKPTPGGGTTEDVDFVKAMLNTSAKFNDVTGQLEITMTGPYDVQPDQSYTIRDIKVIKNGIELYTHPRVEKITGTNDIKIVLDCTSDIGDIDTVSFRYNFANKMWSNIQDIDAPDAYTNHINNIRERIVKSSYIRENDKIILDNIDFIPLPNKVIATKTVNTNRKLFESSMIDKKNKSVIFKVGSLTSDGSEDEDKFGFNIVFKYVYNNVEIELEKTFREIVDTVDVPKVLNLLWEIKNPEDVWGPWTEPFDNPSDPNNNYIKNYAKLLKPLYSNNIVDRGNFYKSNIDYLVPVKTGNPNNEPYDFNNEPYDFNKVLPVSTLVDNLPIHKLEEANIAWCAKFIIKPNSDDWMFTNAVNEVKLEVKLWIKNEEQTYYIKFKNIKMINNQLECTNAYLTNVDDVPITLTDIGIFSDGYVTGVPFTTNNKSKMLNAYKSYSNSNKYSTKDTIPIESFSIEYSRWGNYKQILPLTSIFGVLEENTFLEEYKRDPGNILSYEFLKNECQIFNKYDEKVGIKVKPIIVFKNRTVVKYPEKLIKYRSHSDIKILNEVVSAIGIMSIPDNKFMSRFTRTTSSRVSSQSCLFYTEDDRVIRDLNTGENEGNLGNTSHNMYRHYGITPLNSDFRFKFSPNFKELHFNDGFKHKFFNDMIYSENKLKYKDPDILKSITHIKINYIGEAITKSGNRILDLIDEDNRLLTKFNVSSENYLINKYNTTNVPNIDLSNVNMNVAGNGSRTRDVEYHGMYSDYNSTFNITFNDSTDFIDMSKSLIGLIYSDRHINPNESKASFTPSVYTINISNNDNIENLYNIWNKLYTKSTIYTIPNLLNKYKIINSNLEIFTPTYTFNNNENIQFGLEKPLYYDKYNDILRFVETEYVESNNLLAAPIILQASFGVSKDPNILTPTQKILYKEVPHIIFTTSGDLNGNNKEIFNYRSMLNNNSDYVIKYQIKLENRPEFIDNQLVYYMMSSSISNSLVSINDSFKNSIDLNLNKNYDQNVIFRGGGLSSIYDDIYRPNKKLYNNYMDLFRLKYGNQVQLVDSSNNTEFAKVPVFTDAYKTIENKDGSQIPRVGFKGIYTRGTFVTEEWEAYYNTNNNGLSKLDFIENDLRNKRNMQYYPLYNGNNLIDNINNFSSTYHRGSGIYIDDNDTLVLHEMRNNDVLKWYHLKNSAIFTNDDQFDLTNHVLALNSIFIPRVHYKRYTDTYDIPLNHSYYNEFAPSIPIHPMLRNNFKLICRQLDTDIEYMKSIDDHNNYYYDNSLNKFKLSNIIQNVLLNFEYYSYSNWFKDKGPWIPNDRPVNKLNFGDYRGRVKFIYEIFEAPVSTYSCITTNKNLLTETNLIKSESNLINITELETDLISSIIKSLKLPTTLNNYIEMNVELGPVTQFTGNLLPNYINTSIKNNDDYLKIEPNLDEVLSKHNEQILDVSDIVTLDDEPIYFISGNLAYTAKSMSSIPEADRIILNAIYYQNQHPTLFSLLSNDTKSKFTLRYILTKYREVKLVSNLLYDPSNKDILNENYSMLDVSAFYNRYFVDNTKIKMFFPTINKDMSINHIGRLGNTRDKTLYFADDQRYNRSYDTDYYINNDGNLQVLTNPNAHIETRVQPDEISIDIALNSGLDTVDASIIEITDKTFTSKPNIKIHYSRNLNPSPVSRLALFNMTYGLDPNFIPRMIDNDNRYSLYKILLIIQLFRLQEYSLFNVNVDYLFNGINKINMKRDMTIRYIDDNASNNISNYYFSNSEFNLNKSFRDNVFDAIDRYADSLTYSSNDNSKVKCMYGFISDMALYTDIDLTTPLTSFIDNDESTIYILDTPGGNLDPGSRMITLNILPYIFINQENFNPIMHTYKYDPRLKIESSYSAVMQGDSLPNNNQRFNTDLMKKTLYLNSFKLHDVSSMNTSSYVQSLYKSPGVHDNNGLIQYSNNLDNQYLTNKIKSTDIYKGFESGKRYVNIGFVGIPAASISNIKLIYQINDRLNINKQLNFVYIKPPIDNNFPAISKNMGNISMEINITRPDLTAARFDSDTVTRAELHLNTTRSIFTNNRKLDISNIDNMLNFLSIIYRDKLIPQNNSSSINNAMKLSISFNDTSNQLFNELIQQNRNVSILYSYKNFPNPDGMYINTIGNLNVNSLNYTIDIYNLKYLDSHKMKNNTIIMQNTNICAVYVAIHKNNISAINGYTKINPNIINTIEYVIPVISMQCNTTSVPRYERDYF